MTIGEQLKQLRQQRGYTQEQIAESMHVSVQTVSKWERGVSQT
ncbi:MAG: helix-turn-helix transcriptional regulator [Clostridia bacterium]|nr:helix-turn-helix transcriptional regulator [Clostridia bacterium]